MSNNETEEIINKVTIGVEDVKSIREYFKHFEINLPSSLAKALDVFEKDGSQTIENQNFLKLQLCKTMLKSDHETFKDQMFDVVKETANEAVYNLQFDFDVKDELDAAKKDG